jgi:hypothetical protein
MSSFAQFCFFICLFIINTSPVFGEVKTNQYGQPMVKHTIADVVVDTSNPAYAIFISFSSPEKTREILANIESKKKQGIEAPQFKVLKWDEFVKTIGQTFAGIVKINDYPQVHVQAGLIDLLTYYPESPFGITFNSGIAFTDNDYTHVQRIYSIFTKDVKAYETMRHTNQSKKGMDPVNPLSHLSPLLGNHYPVK